MAELGKASPVAVAELGARLCEEVSNSIRQGPYRGCFQSTVAERGDVLAVKDPRNVTVATGGGADCVAKRVISLGTELESFSTATSHRSFSIPAITEGLACSDVAARSSARSFCL